MSVFSLVQVHTLDLFHFVVVFVCFGAEKKRLFFPKLFLSKKKKIRVFIAWVESAQKMTVFFRNKVSRITFYVEFPLLNLELVLCISGFRNRGGFKQPTFGLGLTTVLFCLCICIMGGGLRKIRLRTSLTSRKHKCEKNDFVKEIYHVWVSSPKRIEKCFRSDSH